MSVEMVITNGGRGDILHPATFQQTPVAKRACAHNQGVGIGHVLGRDGLAGQINRLAKAFGFAAYERDFVVYDDFEHNSSANFFLYKNILRRPSAGGAQHDDLGDNHTQEHR